jgi:hypothetical protein
VQSQKYQTKEMNRVKNPSLQYVSNSFRTIMKIKAIKIISCQSLLLQRKQLLRLLSSLMISNNILEIKANKKRI